MSRICLACEARGCRHVASKVTPREEEILRRLLDVPPLTQKELAFEIQMSHATLKQHLNRLYQRLGFGGSGSFLQAVLWARDHRDLLTDPT